MRNFKITVNGNTYDVQVEETVGANIPAPALIPVNEPEIKAAPAPAATVAAAAAVKPAPAPIKVQAAPVANLSGIKIKSPMPGMVLNFKFSSGDTVKKGQPVLILEAMKMENDICAPSDGKISFIAAKGSNVETGDVLAVIN